MKIALSCMAGALLVFCGCANVAETDSPMYAEYVDLIKTWENPAELAQMSSMNWESRTDCKIVYASEKSVSFKIVSWSYTGGAHGMTDTKVGTVRNGKVMKLDDLPENIKKLWQQALDSHPDIKTIKEYSADGKPQITDNFYLDGKGIHFIYQPYEIAPFSSGTIDVFVPGKFE
ncbi:MAG: DUF3298 domain-containing protein [Lentisphaeria bacterium]|nr:DUF3298 domain-containing protein [Lentisphaeria bacterium]